MTTLPLRSFIVVGFAFDATMLALHFIWGWWS